MKPRPCPYCGHPAEVLHVLTGRDYRPSSGTHPEVWCPRCRRAAICQCRVAEIDAGAYKKPWSARHLVGQWNAQKSRRLSQAQNPDLSLSGVPVITELMKIFI